MFHVLLHNKRLKSGEGGALGAKGQREIVTEVKDTFSGMESKKSVQSGFAGLVPVLPVLL